MFISISLLKEEKKIEKECKKNEKHQGLKDLKGLKGDSPNVVSDARTAKLWSHPPEISPP